MRGHQAHVLREAVGLYPVVLVDEFDEGGAG
jgi:hypothetical protein